MIPPISTQMASLDNVSTRDIDIGVYFLRREDKHKVERPYAFKFDPTDGFPGSNVVDDYIEVHVEDMRGREQAFDLDTHGFCVRRIDEPLPYQDYFIPGRLDMYFRHMEAVLEHLLQASKVKVFRHCVRFSSNPKACHWNSGTHHLPKNAPASC